MAFGPFIVWAHVAPLVTGAVAALVAIAAAGVHACRQGLVPLRAVAVAGLVFQAAHLMEHLAQLAYWVRHPAAAPWLTPWARGGRDLIAAAADGRAGTGTELLHLAGNVVFLIGLVALARLAASGRTSRPRSLSLALTVQGVHVAEHVVLVATWLVLGEAHGLSTLFGLLSPGTTAADTFRVWFHFTVNLAATVPAFIAASAMAEVGLRAASNRAARRAVATRRGM